MNKVIALVFLFLAVISCRVQRDMEKDEGKVKVLSTIAQIGDIVSQIGGDRVSSGVLVQRELNPHTYELVKGDGEKIASAEVIF